ncbi:MAG: indole-3-glycerol phosphate synthase TrpC [Prevotella sp.]|jgi:indole-3-glycerol phosphate synthase|nr:indole-3-glycerol phosphate synthase TrpC [Prevotella sp.]MCI1281784.1 indole-3-glycerol phosphate synthase TrpC [Prevotella sp.]
MDILEEIVAYKRKEIAEFRQILPIRQLYAMAEKALNVPVPSMQKALMESKTGIIAEFKRKSPSKGWIHKDAKSDIVPLDYQRHGATALSILTDQKYFGGYDEFIQAARISGVTIPILYKNFIIDEYQLLQARYSGASAVLLIAACLSEDECSQLMEKAHELGMEVLLEMHSERDLEYAGLEPDMYGINNRNLGTFITNVQNSYRLADKLPKGVCKVSESGIGTPLTVSDLRAVGFRGFLIGETFMKAEKPGEALHEFLSGIKS